MSFVSIGITSIIRDYPIKYGDGFVDTDDYLLTECQPHFQKVLFLSTVINADTHMENSILFSAIEDSVAFAVSNSRLPCTWIPRLFQTGRYKNSRSALRSSLHELSGYSQQGTPLNQFQISCNHRLLY